MSDYDHARIKKLVLKGEKLKYVTKNLPIASIEILDL